MDIKEERRVSILKDKCIYGARIYKDEITGKYDFDYRKIKIISETILGVELEFPCFKSANYSTEYFKESELNHEIVVKKNFSLFYSRDISKCVEWLTNKREELIENARKELENLTESCIVEVNKS